MAFQGIGPLLSFTAPSLRLTLVRGETLSLPRKARSLRVLSGSAWITVEGQDIVLGRQESLDILPGLPVATVVSPLGSEALSFEIE